MRQAGLILAAARVRSKKKESPKKNNTKKSTPPKTHHDIHSSPATATTSRRRETKHVPRISPYSFASIFSGLVEIGLVQLSQSAQSALVEVNEARRPSTCSWPCAFEEKKRKKRKKIPPHPKHTTKSTAARPPRSPRDGVRRNVPRVTHTRPLQ